MKKALPRLLLLLLVKIVTGQPLDWSGDAIVFGSPEDESRPRISGTGSAVLHAFCVHGTDTLAMKRSADYGSSWSDASRIRASVNAPRLIAASDALYTYAVCIGDGSSQRHLFRLSASGHSWSGASELDIAPERTANVLSISAVTDAVAEPYEPYLNVSWMERDGEGPAALVFAQSRDRAASFLPAVVVHSAAAPPNMTAATSMAVSWGGEEERIHIAAPVDRLGSMPEELRVFTSTDQGVTWTDGTVVDPSGWAQNQASIAASGGTLLIVYPRRVDVTSQRDVFLSYSIDGGETFAPVEAVAATSLDESFPRVIADPAGQQFHVFYLLSDGLTNGTLMVRTGNLSTPWNLSEPVSVSDSGTAVIDGGFDVAATSAGIAAVWTAPFVLGDTDIRFDASWRGLRVRPSRELAAPDVWIAGAYPNPFNGVTTISVYADRDMPTFLVITDLLGRAVAQYRLAEFGHGRHEIGINLSGLCSGTYIVSLPHTTAPPQRLMLIR